MNLVIVESPTKARTLSRFLGSEFKIDSTMGHIRDLPKSKLGVDLKDDFKPEYVMVARQEETVKKLEKEAKEAKKVYLATDPDREGEAISYHVRYLLNKDHKNGTRLDSAKRDGKFTRIVFHEITKDAVTEALEHPRGINLQLVNAQQARRVLDRLVGYKLSPLLWRKVRRGLSAGRVQSVAVRLIVEREREIEEFKAEEYWEIYANVKCQSAHAQTANVKSSEFTIQLIKIGEDKAEIKDGKTAKKVVGDLEKAKYEVAEVLKKEVNRSPYPPFTTSTMTQVASRLFFWSAKRTMSVAQKLYEEGLITYHRTDSTNLSIQAVNKARVLIGEKYGKEFVPDAPRFYKIKSKLAQEAHEAIRPTNVGELQTKNSKLKTQNKFRADAEKLYDLIWKRFVASQMTNAVYDQTTIDVKALRLQFDLAHCRRSGQALRQGFGGEPFGSELRSSTPRTSTVSSVEPSLRLEEAELLSRTAQGKPYLLRVSGQVVKFKGWKIVYGRDEQTEQVLPDVQEGEALHLIKVDPQQKFTEPPPRYSEASLIKTLEKLGIGRPSTYAPTISTIQVRQYVEKQQGNFRPTAIGVTVTDFLVKYFPSIVDYQFTAGMEGDLDKIAEGTRKWVPVIKEFWQPFWSKVKEVEKDAKRMKIEVEKTGKKCPKCSQGDEVIRTGRFGKFLSCSRFPDCDWKAPFVQTLGMKCPDCVKKGLPAGRQGEVVIKRSRKGWQFYGCSSYPDCKWASWKKPFDPEQSRSPQGKPGGQSNK